MAKHDTSPLRKILLIDTTDRDQTRLALLDKKELVTFERAARAQALQSMIAELLEKSKTSLSDLQAVAVVTGPGSFTGTRIGITAANTLGWLSHLPLLPMADTDFETALTKLQAGSLPEAEKVIRPLL